MNFKFLRSLYSLERPEDNDDEIIDTPIAYRSDRAEKTNSEKDREQAMTRKAEPESKYVPKPSPGNEMETSSETGVPNSLSVVSLDSEEYLNNIVENKKPEYLIQDIVSLLNDNVPQWMKNCIDVEAESEQVYNHIKSSFRNYLQLLFQDINKANRSVIDAEIIKLEHQIKLKDNTIADFRLEKENMQKDLLSVERQRRTLTERAHELEARLGTVETEKATIDEARRDAKEQLRKLLQKSTSFETEMALWEEQKLELQQKQAQLESEVLVSAEKITAYELQITQLEEKSKSVEELQEYKIRISEMNDMLGKVQEKNHLLNSKIEQTESELQDLRTKAYALDKTNEKLVEIEKQLEAERSLNRQLAEEKQKMADDLEEVSRQSDIEEQLRAALEEAAIENNQIRKQLVEKTNLLEKQSAEKNSGSEVINRLEHELLVANDMCKAMVGQRQEFLDKIEKASQTERIQSQKIDNLTLQLNSANQERNNLKKTIDDLKKDLESNDDSVEDEDNDDNFNWLIPPRPDTPEEIAQRKLEEKKSKEEKKEEAALKDLPDPSQMSLW